MADRMIIRGFLFVFFLFIAFACLIYKPSFHSPFLVDDDSCISYQGKYYKQGPRVLIQHFWALPQTMAVAGRPVTTLTLWFDYKIGGLHPLVYKITNIFLHAFASFLVFVLLRYLCHLHFPLGLSFIPWAASFVFLFHPIHTQVVNIVVQRSVILMAIFGLLGFYTYLRFFHEHKKYFWLLSFICLVLSLFSKASGIAFILIMFFYTIVFAQPKQRTKYLAACCAPLVLLFGILLYLYKNKFHPQHSDLSPLQFLMVETRAIWIYWKLFIFPYPLQFLYDFSTNPSVMRQFTWLAVMGHLGVIGGALYLLRLERYKLCGFSVICAYLSIAPEASFFPMTTPVMEYRTYVSFIFLSFGIMVLSQQWFKRRVLYLSLALLLIFLGAATFNRNAQINTIEKWHYDMVKSFQKWDNMNFYALDLLTQTGDMKRAKDLLVLLAQKRSDLSAYLFLKKLAIDGPKQSLQDNRIMIGSSLRSPSAMLIPFFLHTADMIVLKEYPSNQIDFVLHEIYFYYLAYLVKHPQGMYNLKGRYLEILNRLRIFYDGQSLLTQKQEGEREKVQATISVLEESSKKPYKLKLEKILEEHPFWRVFF